LGVITQFLCGLTLLLPLAVQAQDPVATIPYRIDYGGWFTVEATVNGQGPYDFIIDTGATQSLVFTRLNAIYAFPASGGPPQEVLGLLSSGKFPTFVIGDIAVGNAQIDDLVTVILPDWTVEGRAPYGVLGLDFLKRYRIVFDAPKGELRLYDLAQPIAEAEAWKTAKLKRDDFGREAGDLFVIDARLNGRKISFLFDIGASGTIINHPALGRITRGVSIRAGPSGDELASRISDALEERADARAVEIRRIEAGRTTWYRWVVIVHNAPIIKDLGLGSKPFGLFGADLLHDRSFALDFARDRLLIGPRVKKKD
jgi:hypothetical protein